MVKLSIASLEKSQSETEKERELREIAKGLLDFKHLLF